MDIKEFIFQKEKSTPSHISFRLFGIKMNFLRPSIKRERKKIAKYYQSFENASLIPPAEGELRLIQKANAELLKIFHDICQENKLQYWIDFGTLLGAVRHKGFIPWDDDIDVGMPREDYEKLIQLFQNNEIGNADLFLLFENNKNNKCFAKIMHRKSENMFLDIFPYDLYHSKLSDEEKTTLSERIVEARKNRPNSSNRTESAMRAHFAETTTNIILDGKTPNKEEKPAIFMAIDFPHNWKNKVYDWENIFPLKEILFEDKKFLAPNKFEEVLTSIYGDYMKIPKNSYPRHTSYLTIRKEEKAFLEEITK